MISIEKALEIVLSQAKPLPSINVPLQNAKSYRLSEPIFADMDTPSFDRAMMDGYALMALLSGVGREIEVDGIIVAGEFRSDPVPQGKAVKIMTGAPVPEGVDAVIQVELTSEIGENRIRLNGAVNPGDNVARKGSEIKKGQKILKEGTTIDPSVASVLAMAGKHEPKVFRLPEVGILSSGTELVEPGEPVKPGQIRESNSYGLSVQCNLWGAVPVRLGIAGDDPDQLKSAIQSGLKFDILAITGGVSMGDFDLIPDILREMGVDILFHKVNQKPGKPVLYGKFGNSHVFGLPGNPVAAFLDFELYVGPLIRRMAGEEGFESKWLSGITMGEFRIKSDKPHLKPVRVGLVDGVWQVEPASSMGSADILSIVGTNAFAKFTEGRYTVPSGERVQFLFHRGKPYGA
jgi:molybdopterin molybdotransferase